MWLKELEFDRVDPYGTLLAILFMCYGFRLVAWGMLAWREQVTMRLADITDYHEVRTHLVLFCRPGLLLSTLGVVYSCMCAAVRSVWLVRCSSKCKCSAHGNDATSFDYTKAYHFGVASEHFASRTYSS